jgi:hypothetical protein
MAVLVFGIYMAAAMGLYGLVVEGMFPKETRTNCNDSVDPLWPVR